MKLSLFSVLDEDPRNPGNPGLRYAQILEMAGAADQGGLEALWVAEHHFQPGGLCPSPPVLLAAIAARTRRLRVGAMVSVLPFHPAVDLAEQYALLDQLSGGRVNLGVGSGYIGLELDAFGITPDRKRTEFDEGYETLTQALRGEPISVHPGSTPPVRLNVLPVQRPHPPIWIAVQRSEAIPFVARRGANLALVPYATLDNLDQLRDQIADYRRALPSGVLGRVSVAYHLYVGPDGISARSAFQRFLDSRRATQSTFYLQQVAKDARHASGDHLESAGLVALGDPAHVLSKLRALRAADVDEVLGIVDFGGLPSGEVLGSIRELGKLSPSVAGPTE